MVLAVVPHLAVIERLDITLVAVAVGELGVLLEEALDGLELLLSNTQRALHHEVLNALSARRNGERAEVRVVLAIESLLELAETDLVRDGGGTSGLRGGVGPVNALEERVGETAGLLLVPQNDNGGKIVQAGGALLLVDDVGFHRVVTVLVGLGVDGVLGGSMEVHLLDVVLLSIAGVATTDGDEAEVTLHLERMAIVGERQTLSRLVVEVKAERLSIGLTSTDTGGGGGVDVDGGLGLAGKANTSIPVRTTLGVIPSKGLGSSSGCRVGGNSQGNSTSEDKQGQLHFDSGGEAQRER